MKGTFGRSLFCHMMMFNSAYASTEHDGFDPLPSLNKTTITTRQRHSKRTVETTYHGLTKLVPVI